MRATIEVIGMSALLLPGCASVGPSTITRDRFDYVSAISESWKQQTLLNLLKVRYTDAPVFMEVGSVISSYSLEGEISLGAQYAASGRGDAFGSVGTTGRFADTPTITYQPLSGDRFARSLMTPIPITGVLSLLQSGYPADLVLRLCVNTINGLDNAYGGHDDRRLGDPRFRELMTAMRESQAAGDTGFRVKAGKDTQAVVMFIRSSPDKAAVSGGRVRELLGLSPTEREFTVTYGSIPEHDAEIAVLTRSILQVMIDLASYIDVPAADTAEGSVSSPQRSAEQERLFPPLLTVRHGSSPPENAHVAVTYRKHSFWIEDGDPKSKRMLSFLMLMFSLTESAPTQPAPVVTVPTR